RVACVGCTLGPTSGNRVPLAHPTGTRDHVPGRFAGATRRRLPDRYGSPVLDRAGVGLVEASPDQLGRAGGRWPVLPQSRLATGHRRGARRARRGTASAPARVPAPGSLPLCDHRALAFPLLVAGAGGPGRFGRGGRLVPPLRSRAGRVRPIQGPAALPFVHVRLEG